MSIDPMAVWANMTLKIWPERYWMFGPFRVVSTDGELPFDVIGFLGPVLRVLNEHGIKAGPQCGAVFDHLFIYERDVERAMAFLEDFISQARACQ